MSEDKFEEFLRKSAQSYNPPPTVVPREDMWKAIEAKRAAGPRVVYGGGIRANAHTQRRFGQRIWWSAAAAALLLVGSGIGIGRWSAHTTSDKAVTSASAKTIQVEPVQVTRDKTPEESTQDATLSPRSVASTGRTAGGTRDAHANGPQRVTAPVPQVASSCAVIRGCGAIDASGASTGPNQTSPYQIAAVRHLSDAEALLTSFRTRSAADQQMDSQLASWARELLSNTRLLLDSPAANDPQRRPLLEDLELILVQIVQLSPGSTAQDRELIEKALQQDHVLTRLRTAIPAGAQRGS
jgi:hypothetical protein